MNSGTDLKNRLCEINNGIYSEIVNTFDIKDVCLKCNFFNLSIKDIRQGYRCHCPPSCIAATLNPDIISLMNWKIGLIDHDEHLTNLGIKNE